MPTVKYEHWPDDAEDPIIYEVEYRRTKYHPAEPSWYGGAGSPAEGGEAIITSIEPAVPEGNELWDEIQEWVDGLAE